MMVWQQQDTDLTARTVDTCVTGMYDIGPTNQHLLINEPYMKQQQCTMDGMEMQLFEARKLLRSR